MTEHKPSTKTYNLCPRCGCREEKHEMEMEGLHYCAVCGSKTYEATYRQLGLGIVVDEDAEEDIRRLPGLGRPILQVFDGGASRR